jgi:thiamine-monophosphate kinase
MRGLAAEHRVNLLGGDTTGSKGDLVINLTVVGSVAKERMLTRDAAKPGDCIFCTGRLGDSRAGLHMILNHLKPDGPDEQALFNAHILPRPHLDEGDFLSRQKGVHAAIDVSDGLASDLGHILEQSRVGARLQAEDIPVSPQLQNFCYCMGFDALDYAINGGEDYCLILTITPEWAEKVRAAYVERFGRPLYELGGITSGGGLELENSKGRVTRIAAGGWDHFKGE